MTDDNTLITVRELNNKILLVDDDGDVLKIVSTVLNFEGFQVITASSGVEALEILENQTPSLIVLDIEMPIMDGYALFEKLQNHKVFKTIPVIVITAKKEPKKMEGVKATLSKALNIESFLAMVMQHCVPEITEAREA